MAATIRATATTGIIRATAITPTMITDIIRAPIIGPTPIVPIPITIGAIGIEDGGPSWCAQSPAWLRALRRHFGLSRVRWQRPHGSGARWAGRGCLGPSFRSGHCAGLANRPALDG